MEVLPLLITAEMFPILPHVMSTPNASQGNVTKPQDATILPFSSVTITLFVHQMCVMIRLAVNISPALLEPTVKIQMIAMLPFVTHSLDASKPNFNVIPVTIVLLLVAILSGTTRPLMKMEKPKAANALTHLAHATNAKCVQVLLLWLQV
jgi:hypothetical protein